METEYIKELFFTKEYENSESGEYKIVFPCLWSLRYSPYIQALPFDQGIL